MLDQQNMSMTVHQVRVHGATNLRRGFLDPILKPLVGDGSDAPSTMGEVLAHLQLASSKLSGLRRLLVSSHTIVTNWNRDSTTAA